MIPTPPAAAEKRPTVPRVVRFEVAPRSLVALVITVALVWMTVRLVPVLLVLVGALMLVGALNPVVRWLEERHFRRSLAIAIVFTTAVGLTILTAVLTVPSLIDQLRTLVENEPKIRAHVVEYLSRSPLTQTLAEQLQGIQYGDLLKNSHGTLLITSLHALEDLAYAIAAIFLALYLMIDHVRLRGALFAIVPRNHHVRFSRVLVNLETIVGGYIRGQVITCVLIAVFILAVLLICGVPNALALAVFGALMDVLPYIGPLLTIVPAVAAAYSVSPGIAVTVLALLILYEEFEGRLLIPLVYGRALRLPSSVVFFALLAGAGLGGILGALLALPIASAALMLIQELRVELPGESELPEVEAARQRDQSEEREYVRLTDETPVKDASAVAVEIARERKKEEQEEEDEQVEQDKQDKKENRDKSADDASPPRE